MLHNTWTSVKQQVIALKWSGTIKVEITCTGLTKQMLGYNTA